MTVFSALSANDTIAMSQIASNSSDEASQEATAVAPLGREEYVEQAHFFQSLGERLQQNIPAQEVIASLREEVLATTKLPMAVDFLLSELRHAGVMGTAMAKLPHYFTPLQAYIVEAGESEGGRFDLRVGLDILRRDAEYRAGVSLSGQSGLPSAPTRQGLFLYQFEALCRNRLSYDRGLTAIAADSAFAETWREWILQLRGRVGMVDVADIIYVHSEHAKHVDDRKRSQKDGSSSYGAVILFGEREGRIALANRKKNPLLLFNSLHRQLGYPEVPQTAVFDEEEALLPQLARRVEQMEKRLGLLEEEQRGGFDLTQFYEPPRE